MKFKLTILLFFSAIGFCIAQTQYDMNSEAFAEYKKADQELNQIYQQILVEYKSDTLFIKNLRNAQRIWVQFRDAELAMKYPEKEPGYYGSVHPMCVSSYLAFLTNERVKTLKEWTEGTMEGDVCSGSVKINY